MMHVSDETKDAEDAEVYVATQDLVQVPRPIARRIPYQVQEYLVLEYGVPGAPLY